MYEPNPLIYRIKLFIIVEFQRCEPIAREKQMLNVYRVEDGVTAEIDLKSPSAVAIVRE